MSVPCHEGPPATRGHFCSEPAVAGGGRYYCIDNCPSGNYYYNYGDFRFLHMLFFVYRRSICQYFSICPSYNQSFASSFPAMANLRFLSCLSSPPPTVRQPSAASKHHTHNPAVLIRTTILQNLYSNHITSYAIDSTSFFVFNFYRFPYACKFSRDLPSYC